MIYFADWSLATFTAMLGESHELREKAMVSPCLTIFSIGLYSMPLFEHPLHMSYR